VGVFLSNQYEVYNWQYFIVGSHNFVKFTVIELNCQKHSGCVFASGENVMYPYKYIYSTKASEKEMLQKILYSYYYYVYITTCWYGFFLALSPCKYINISLVLLEVFYHILRQSHHLLTLEISNLKQWEPILNILMDKKFIFLSAR